MKFLKKIFQGLLVILVLLNIAILVTGKTYLYKGIANTYLQGRKGPSIDEYKIFENRKILADVEQAWPAAGNFNKTDIPAEDTAYFRKQETVAFLIIKNDSLCFEKYWEGYDENSVTNSFSMAKTFTGILIGIAIMEGKIKNVDQPVGDFLPEFKNGENAKLTIRHLLTMSSGINFDEDYANPLAYPAAAYYGSDLRKLTLKYKVTEEPGKVFKYLSGNTALLGFIIEKVTGKKLGEYMSEKLWIPMGAKNNAYWGMDNNDMEKAYCCFNSNARDFARFGYLFLNNGNWHGKELVAEEHVKQSIAPASLTDENGKPNNKYGYAWWIINHKGHNIFYARGILGQYVFVIPDRNMIVVRLGKKRDKQEGDEHPRDVFVYLDAALQMEN